MFFHRYSQESPNETLLQPRRLLAFTPFSPLFHPQAPEEWKLVARETLGRRIDLVARRLETSSYLMGERFTVADAYLFTVLGWARVVKFDLSPWPVLAAYRERVAVRPAVKAALLAEGLIKEG